jgi:hypothetical protein
MIIFQNETHNSAKSTEFENFIFIQHWLTQTMWSIGATICIFNNKLQKISFKILSYEKVKKAKKDS